MKKLVKQFVPDIQHTITTMKFRKEEKHNLQWHTYTDHLREMLHEMMKSNELTDVTLITDDQRQFKQYGGYWTCCI